ncbi:MAG: class II aldolase/adducin family protein [Chloroflexota bacterium]|nr:class II aldolase/adducin family protein [Chloroflexota bacterium]
MNAPSLVDHPAVVATRARVAEIGALMYDRFLTDAGGGNITARVHTEAGDVLCMSPRYSGSRHLWRLSPDQVLVITLDGQILDGGGELSRETKVHLKLHTTFAAHGSAVIHAHARNVLVFCALNRPMPPVLEQTRKFGTIPVVEYAPAHSQNLADNIADALRGNESRIEKQAAAALAPWHGIFVMGKDLEAAYDAVERIDTNAYILMMGGKLAESMGDSEDFDTARGALERAITAFK